MIEIKIPAVIRIGGLDYDVALSEETDKALDARQWYGSCSRYLLRIEINTRLRSQQLSTTFLHEILHAVDDIYGGDILEEKDLARLANGLHQVMEQLGVRFVK